MKHFLDMWCEQTTDDNFAWQDWQKVPLKDRTWFMDGIEEITHWKDLLDIAKSGEDSTP